MSSINITESTKRTTFSKRQLVGLTFVLGALSWIGPFSIDAYLPSLPSISKSLHVSEAQVQLTMTAFMSSFAIMSLWYGAISDAYGRRRLTLIAMAVFSLASVGCAFSTSIGQLMFFRALQGGTAGAGMVVGRAVVRDLFDGPAAQRLMSHVSTIFTIAPIMAPVIGGWLQVWFNWRAVFFFLVLLTAFLFLSCWHALPETLPRENRQRLEAVFLARSYWKVLTEPSFLLASISMTLTNTGLFIYIMAAPVFLMKHLKLRETEFLWLFAPISVGMLIGAWLSGHYAEKLSGIKTVSVGYVIMAVAAAGNVALNLLLPPALQWSITPLFVFVIGMAMAMPSLTIMTLDLFPAQRGLASSCQGFIALGINALVPALVPLVWGTPLSLALTQVSLLIGGGVAILLYIKITLKNASAKQTI